MMFRNSHRLLLSNFITVWKVLVYQIIVFLTTFSVATIFSLPLVNALKDNNFFELVKTEFGAITFQLNLANILNSLYTVGQEFFAIIGNNLDTVLFSFIMVVLVLFLLGGFLMGLSKLALTEMLNGYMSSYANYSFTSSYVRTFKKSVTLQLFRLLINLPINLLILTIIYFTLPLLSATGFLGVLAPFIIILVATLLLATNLTVFSGVAPAIVVHDYSVLKAYSLGFQAVKRRFFKTLSTSIAIILVILSVNLFLFVLTSGVSCIITLPASTFLLAIFPMVMYYGSMGMRYYVDPETILSPKKLEEQDSLNKAKFII
ncbi:MAG: hypothetical protein CVV59_00900 [Tenericutes bacterium HGW-Tenericutes-4]|nr:MAG: hypothetical protein CVV59_00900 [Tenericutes bacterium HGW-Tenericutes-4]